jgi:transglutaminase-like putative cysteine protease
VPHGELSVVSTVVADVTEAGDSPQIDWERLAGERTADAFAETLAATPRSEAPADLVAQAREAIGGLAPHEAARAVCGVVNQAMEYAPGSTGVQTKAVEAWAARRGVCQDITHLALGALRAVGVPARYVSGYAAPRGDVEVGEPVAGESHSWIEWWSGGWYGWDPTSDGPAGSRHLAVARGRDYGDVAPLKGIVAGTGSSSLDVSVMLTVLS